MKWNIFSGKRKENLHESMQSFKVTERTKKMTNCREKKLVDIPSAFSALIRFLHSGLQRVVT